MSYHLKNNGMIGSPLHDENKGMIRLSQKGASGKRSNGGVVGKKKLFQNLEEAISNWSDSLRQSGIWNLSGLHTVSHAIYTTTTTTTTYQEYYWVYPSSYQRTVNVGDHIYGTWNPSPEICNYQGGVMWTSLGINGLDLRSTGTNFQWHNVGACPWDWTANQGGSPYTYTVYPPAYQNVRNVTTSSTTTTATYYSVWGYF
tara:strand:+ start:457 stop:1056 length:600 start_codon:yes stop_codon:yes gene_type:complete